MRKFNGYFLVWAVSVSALHAQSCPYQVVAGPVGLGDSGPATSAYLLTPGGVAVDAAGNVYIADTQQHRVRKVNTGGTIVTIAGNGTPGMSGDGGPGTTASLRTPQAVAIAADGSAYIADTGNHKIRLVSPDGTITTFAGTGHPGFSGDGGPATAAELNGPMGLAIDSSGALYVADTNNNRIRKIDGAGRITTMAGSSYSPQQFCCSAGDGGPAVKAQLQGPQAVAVGPGGVVYIADTLNSAVRRVAADGTSTTAAGTPGGFGNPTLPGSASQALGQPTGLVAMADGTLVIASFEMLQLSADGQTLSLWSSHQAGAIATDYAGGMYLTNFDQVYRIAQRNGTADVFAGAAHQGKSADGSSAAGSVFNQPVGLSTGADGALYIADYHNGRVVKLSNGLLRNAAAAQGPAAVAVDAAGNIFTADFSAGLIRKTTPDGTTQTIAGGGFGSPPLPGDSAAATSVSLNGSYRTVGIVAHPNGNVFVELVRTGSISGLYLVMITPDGRLTTVFTTVTPGGLTGASAPVYQGLGLDSTGHVLMPIAPLFHGALAFDGAGKQTTGAVFNTLNSLSSIAGGPGGAIYYTDVKGRVERVSADGHMSTLYNRDLDQFTGISYDGAATSQLPAFSNVAVDSAGNVFVSERNLGQILEFPASSCNLLAQPVLSAVTPPPAPFYVTASGTTFAPGEIVSIYGAGLGPESAVTAGVNNRFFPTSAGGVQVLFEGIPGPVLYAGSNQVNAIIPFTLYGYQQVRVQVQYNGVLSDATPLTMAPTAPAIFTYTVGKPILPIVVNPDGSLNSSSNPAPAGSYVTIYLTGLGLTSPAGQDGHLATAPLPVPVEPVTIDANSGCTILYAGDAPGIVEGFSQVNIGLPKTPISTSVTLNFGGATLDIPIASK
jgi:uncharacterized protein (TIGR03437 family)